MNLVIAATGGGQLSVVNLFRWPCFVSAAEGA
jgi:hypothetical protein